MSVPPGNKKFSPELVEEFVEAVELGMSIRRASALVGVNPWTVYDWMKKGEQDPESEYGEFTARLEQARAKLQRRALDVVVEDSLDPAQDPKVRLAAAKFILDRVFKDDFASKQITEHTGPGGGPVQVQARPAITTDQARQLTDEQLERALAELRGETAGEEIAPGVEYEDPDGVEVFSGTDDE